MPEKVRGRQFLANFLGFVEHERVFMYKKVKKRAGKRWVLGKKKPCFAIKGFVFPNKTCL